MHVFQQLKLQQLKLWLDKTLILLATLNLITLVLVVLWQVFTRFVTQSPSTGTDELACHQMISLTLLGSAYTAGQKRHLSIDFFTSRNSKSEGVKSRILYHVVVGTFALLAMVAGGYWLAKATLSTGQISPALGIKAGYLYLIMPVAGLFIALYSLIFILEQCNGSPPAGLANSSANRVRGKY